jgi:hypothetical protein
MNLLGHCPQCGDVHLTIRDCTVRVLMETDERTCVYQCPTCGCGISRKLCSQVSAKLVNMGVKLVFWRWPAELAEPHVGPAFTSADVYEMGRLLASDRWLERLSQR